MKELNEAIQRGGTLTVLHTNAIASKVGLSATEFEALDIIGTYQPMTAGKLSTYCGLTTGAITGLVDRLSRVGVVKRMRDPEDRRRVFIIPIKNEEKNRRVGELYGPISRVFEKTVGKYTEEQLQLLVDFHKAMNDEVEKIIANLREQ
jgi:DNA-binding MarR family transcriptional regulator